MGDIAWILAQLKDKRGFNTSVTDIDPYVVLLVEMRCAATDGISGF